MIEDKKEIKKARFDVTYCTNKECAKRFKCGFNCVEYEFEEDENYWFMENCSKFEYEVVK